MSDENTVEIRPNVSMYTAFARLNYEPWYALAEFIDNALQSYLANLDALRQAEGKAFRLRVGIEITEDKIEIRDNAAGIALVDFSRAFSPASPPPDTSGLSEFGLGMKAAACWFAQRWSVRTAALGEEGGRVVVYDIPEITRNRIEQLPVGKLECWDTEHFTHLTLEVLNVTPKGRTIAKIKDHLTSIYRKFLRDGTMELRVQGALLTCGHPTILRAPRADHPEGAVVEWHKANINIDLRNGRRVTGWAALLERGDTANAGLALFRRGRLIEGSHGDTYRPEFIFGRSNSFAFQRLIGELDVEGLSVSHTKDGIQWDGLEEEFLDKLHDQLDAEPVPLLWQAREFRSKKRASALPPLTTRDEPAEAPQLPEQRVMSLVADSGPERSEEIRDDSTLKLDKLRYETNLSLYHQGQHWRVVTEVISDETLDDWLDMGEERETADERVLHIRLNVAHPFLERFISPSGDEMTAYVRLGAALAVSEATARAAGVRQAGSIRRSLNQILREALSGPVQLTMPRSAS